MYESFCRRDLLLESATKRAITRIVCLASSLLFRLSVKSVAEGTNISINTPVFFEARRRAMNDRRGTMAFSVSRIWASGMPALLLLVDEPSLFPTVWFLAETRLYRAPHSSCRSTQTPPRDFCLCMHVRFSARDGSSCARLEITAKPCRFFPRLKTTALVGAVLLPSLSYLTRLFQRSFDHSNIIPRFEKIFS